MPPHPSSRRVVRPLDSARLEALAVRYVGRYATTRAKLRAYLDRKLRERGWDGDAPADLERLVDRMAALGYVDDRAFATMRGAALTRRGFGGRRIDAALRAAGVSSDDGATASATAHDESWAAALALARRRRIGPFAAEPPDRAGREKMIAILMRAGHDHAIARRVISLEPGITEDEADAQ